MTTHMKKIWFDGDKLVEQHIPESEIYKREWVGLTDEEIDHLAEFHGLDYMSYEPFTKAIEAKLKQKNGYAEEKNNG